MQTPLIEVLSLAIVGLAGLYLLGLGLASLAVPARASRFLLGFASTREVHFAEMLLRVLVGAALVTAAPRLFLPGTFGMFGWILMATSACLLLFPWRWHRRFARQVVPRAVRRITWIGLVSLALGGFFLVAALATVPK